MHRENVMSNQPQKVSIIPQDEPTALVPVTPMDMLNRAVQSGADIDMIEKLMNLQERWEASNARKAFDEAVAAAKAEIPAIQRNATGHNSKKYADFAAIARVVDPIIGKHGLSYRFRTTQNGKISVTCVLSHKAGHSEETTLPARRHDGQQERHPGHRLNPDLPAALLAGADARACRGGR
jgi:hypothetical protein